MQVIPIWIGRFNQSNFPTTIPALDLLFAKDRLFDFFALFKPHQLGNTVLFGKPFNKFIFVRPDSLDEIGSDADYKVPLRWLLSRYT